MHMTSNLKLNILVLGVGGNISQGILKALHKSKLDCRVIGACVTPYALGLYTTDMAYVSPYANDPKFVEWLYDICQKEHVDAVLTGVEEILTLLAVQKENLRQKTGAVCIVSDSVQLLIGDDKLLTCQWLKQNGFNYPEFADCSDALAVNQLIEAVGFPLVVKPRKGKSSLKVYIIRCQEDLERLSIQSGYVVEQYLGTEDTEYTVGCFCDKQGDVKGSIVMKRRLFCGTTSWAEVEDCDPVRQEAERIVAKLKPMGPCNVQMRVAGDKAICFELNIRFSGTTPIRAHFGFNDVDMALRHFILNESIGQLPKISSGIAVRYWNEVYVDPQAFGELVKKGNLDPRAYKTSLENYGEN